MGDTGKQQQEVHILQELEEKTDVSFIFICGGHGGAREGEIEINKHGEGGEEVAEGWWYRKGKAEIGKEKRW